MQHDFARHRSTWNELVHPVQNAQERRLATSRRTDEAGHRVRREEQIDVFERMVLVEPRMNPACLETCHPTRHRGRRLLCFNHVGDLMPFHISHLLSLPLSPRATVNKTNTASKSSSEHAQARAKEYSVPLCSKLKVNTGSEATGPSVGE